MYNTYYRIIPYNTTCIILRASPPSGTKSILAQMDLSSWKVVYFLTLISASDALNFPEMEIYLVINQTLTPNFYLCVPLAHGPSLPSCHVGSARVRRRCPAHCAHGLRNALGTSSRRTWIRFATCALICGGNALVCPRTPGLGTHV